MVKCPAVSYSVVWMEMLIKEPMENLHSISSITILQRCQLLPLGKPTHKNHCCWILTTTDEDKGNGISLKSYKLGSCLFAFDLSPDHDDGNHWDLVRDGSTTINIRFGAAVPAGGIEVVVYAEFDNLITIDQNRHTFIDYKA